MKKFGMFAMAIALLLPMVALTAGPAGAAAGTTCKPPSGKLTFSPGVGATLKVQTISINLPITGCVGGGVTGGTFKIVRVLPEERGVWQYRVKSVVDGHERVVLETDLTH